MRRSCICAHATPRSPLRAPPPAREMPRMPRVASACMFGDTPRSRSLSSSLSLARSLSLGTANVNSSSMIFLGVGCAGEVGSGRTSPAASPAGFDPRPVERGTTDDDGGVQVVVLVVLCERHRINYSRARLNIPKRLSRPRPRARGALRACGRHAPGRRGAQGMPRRARSVAPGRSNPGQIGKIPCTTFGRQTFVTTVTPS